MSRHCGQPWCSKTSITPLLNMPALGITWHASAQTCARASSWNAKRKDQVAVCSAGISCQIPHKQKSTTTHSSCVPAGSLMPSHLVVLQLSLTHNAGSRRCWGKGWCRRAQPIFDISNRRRKKKKNAGLRDAAQAAFQSPRCHAALDVFLQCSHSLRESDVSDERL